MEKRCLRTETSFLPGVNKGLGSLLNVNFVRRKLIPLKKLYQLSFSDDKMWLVTGIIGKEFKLVQFFCFHKRRNVIILKFDKSWATAKTKSSIEFYIIYIIYPEHEIVVKGKHILAWPYFMSFCIE